MISSNLALSLTVSKLWQLICSKFSLFSTANKQQIAAGGVWALKCGAAAASSGWMWCVLLAEYVHVRVIIRECLLAPVCWRACSYCLLLLPYSCRYVSQAWALVWKIRKARRRSRWLHVMQDARCTVAVLAGFARTLSASAASATNTVDTDAADWQHQILNFANEPWVWTLMRN